MNQKKIYCIGIGWIGVSALARYYLSQWYEVFWSDSNNSKLIEALIWEWCDIIIWASSSRIDNSFETIIYSEAVPTTQGELLRARELQLLCLKYSEALWRVVNEYKLITVSWTHGKSTTSSMIAQVLKHSWESFSAVIGTILKEFGGKNFYTQWDNNFFVIEACEYKEHFHAYKPLVAVITNIEYDHADYFKTPESYVQAYENFIHNILPWGFCILDANEKNSSKLIWKRSDINYIAVSKNSFELRGVDGSSEIFDFPEIVLHVPGSHILYDAKLSYVVTHMIGISDKVILESLENYSGVWRRMEKIGTTENWNMLISDYGHHPTEIQVTLQALRDTYPEHTILCVFQPHQYSRTIELIEWFKESFDAADTLIVPNIYESRDSEADKINMNTEIFLEAVNHKNSKNGKWLIHTAELIQKFDIDNPNNAILLLLWAWDIDSLRDKIKTS